MDSLIYGLYCTCHDYEIRYVGQTIQGAAVRLGEHRKHSKRPESPVQRWIAKHGAKNVVMEILEECDIAILNEREVFWIVEKNTFRDNSRRGLNMTTGGNGCGYSLETRERLRAANSGEKPWTKLTWEIVRSIREEYATGVSTYTTLAARYGTRVTAISDVVKNITWVDPDYMPTGIVNKRKIEVGPNRKFSDFEVSEVRRMWLTKEFSLADLAAHFGMSRGHIADIVGNKTRPDPNYVNTKMENYSMPQAQRDKISAANKGKHKPPSHGARVSLGLRGKHGMSKLDEDQARDVLRRVRAGESQQDLAAEYGVSKNSISRIKTGARWAYLQEEEL